MKTTTDAANQLIKSLEDAIASYRVRAATATFRAKIRDRDHNINLAREINGHADYFQDVIDKARRIFPKVGN